MPNTNVIDDVRAAKAWVDAQSTSWQEMGARLRAIEVAFEARTGVYANVPRARPESVRIAIDRAEDEPGRDLLQEAKPARTVYVVPRGGWYLMFRESQILAVSS